MMLLGFHVRCAVITRGNDKAVAIDTRATPVTKARQFTNEASDTETDINQTVAILSSLCNYGLIVWPCDGCGNH